MSGRPADDRARAGDGDPTSRREADRAAPGARYTLAAAREAGYRALERLDDEMALASVARAGTIRRPPPQRPPLRITGP